MKKLHIIFALNFIFLTSNSNAERVLVTPITQTAKSNPVLKGWIEKPNIDKFTNEDRTTARLNSDNQQSVGLGSNKISAIIVAFKNPEAGFAGGKIWFGNTAMPLGLTYSQGECYSSTCEIFVKFDDGPIVKFPVYEPSSSDSRGQLIINSREFFQKSFKAKKIEIRVAFYKEGNGDFVFYSDSPFSWSKMKR